VRGAALRSLTRLLRYVAVAVLAVVIIAGAGAAFTQTSWFKNWLRLKAVSQAAQYLNGELTIDRLGGTIFTGVARRLQPAHDDLRRSDPRLAEARQPDNPPRAQ
jgi:type II secretory pathway pseudopilin PulG